MANRALSLGAGVFGAIGMFLAIRTPAIAPASGIAPNEVASEVAARVRETSVGLSGRVETFATLPALQNSASTNPETVRKQGLDELSLRPRPEEIITFGQVPVQGPPEVLRVVPEGAMATHEFETNGTRPEVIDGKLRLVEVLPVTPSDKERAKEVRGAIGVSWPVDLHALVQRLDAVGSSARLLVGDKTVMLGSSGFDPAQAAPPIALPAGVGEGIRVVALVPPMVASLPLRPIGYGLCALAAVLGLLGLRSTDGVGSERGGTIPGVSHATTLRGATGQVGDEIRVGSVIENTYEVTGLLGQGGMGAVWQAKHLRLPDKRVAIKLLLTGMADNEELMARFRREAEVTSKLGHPNIVGVSDFNVLPSGSPYIVLEYLEGESLAKRISRGPIPIDKTLFIVRQIASALHAAHRAHIVHRDLKPDNVFLVPVVDGTGGGEQVKVLDFGISKMRGNLTVQTQDATMLGTPQYMSPEQANGKNSEVDARSDVWALGAITYEMLTGRVAFNGDSLTTLLVNVLVTPSPTLHGVAGVPDQVAQALERALAKEPSARFPDMPSFIDALTGAPLVTQPNMPTIAPSS